MNTATLKHTNTPGPSEPSQKHWTRQFWPWFLILLPASAVVASMFTITLAVQNAPTITDRDIGRFARESAIVETDAVIEAPVRADQNPQ